MPNTNKNKIQKKLDEAMGLLNILDFNNLDKLVRWLVSIREASDNMDITVDHEKILRIFKQNGFTPTYVDEKIKTRQQLGRYLISLALRYLQHEPNAIHVSYEIMAKKYFSPVTKFAFTLRFWNEKLF